MPDALIRDGNLSASEAATIRDRLLNGARRVLLFGPPGAGKSTLAGQLAQVLSEVGRRCWCLSADPGSPRCGPPGAISLAEWRSDGWQVEQTRALCTLDAGRFRLPLVTAVRELAAADPDGVLLVDGPGVVRGAAGAELLEGLGQAAAVELVLVISAADRPPPLADQLRSLAVPVALVRSVAAAKSPGRRARGRQRTGQWQAYLAQARTRTFGVAGLRLLGSPPPLAEPAAWTGRQVALLRDGQTLALGEVSVLQGDRLTLRVPAFAGRPDALLVRDARCDADGLLSTAPPFAAEPLHFLPPADVLPALAPGGGPRLMGRVGALDAALVNGVFGDPLLHLRLRQQGRSLLFDLGDGARLPAHLAHQVSDVFISHAHMDHLGGFLWLLRSRIGDFPACRLYGPPGLAGHVQGLVEGFLWDRVGEQGPVFEVAELHGTRLRRWRIQAGRPDRETLDEQPADGGIVRSEPGFRIRAVELDHHTPVLAFAFEPDREVRVRKDRLAARGLQPGPWLSALKQQVMADDLQGELSLPDGGTAAVAELAAELLLIAPGKRLVYATDLDDNPGNRERLVTLARHAHTLFCEATFLEEDRAAARRNGHLTARACGEIASAAQVARLVPFHLSRRYLTRPEAVWDELLGACRCVALPRDMGVFQAPGQREPGTVELGAGAAQSTSPAGSGR